MQVETVNLTQKDRKAVLAQMIEVGGERLTKCIQCGACASVCPVAITGLPLYCKRLFRFLQTGHLEEIIDDASPWACVACNRCTEICPRGVDPFHVVFAFRRIQAQELAISTSATTSLMNFYTKGHAVYGDASELRQKVGLDPVPPSTLKYPEALKELQTLLDESPMAELGLF